STGWSVPVSAIRRAAYAAAVMRVNDAAGCLHPMPETPALLYVSFFGSQANAASSRGYVRFSAESGHRGLAPKCPLCAKSGHMHCNNKAILFDHLVGEREQLVGYFEAERLRGP